MRQRVFNTIESRVCVLKQNQKVIIIIGSPRHVSPTARAESVAYLGGQSKLAWFKGPYSQAGGGHKLVTRPRCGWSSWDANTHTHTPIHPHECRDKAGEQVKKDKSLVFIALRT